MLRDNLHEVVKGERVLPAGKGLLTCLLWLKGVGIVRGTQWPGLMTLKGTLNITRQVS